MVLRLAERQKNLRKLSSRNYTTRLNRAELTTNNNGTKHLDFSPGLSVIAGGNGAGKSTLLGAIWRCLSAAASQYGAYVPGTPPWLREICVSGVQTDTEFTAHLDVASGVANSTFNQTVFYIDPAAETEDILKKFRADAQPSDLLEGIDPASFSTDQLGMLSYVLRRDYSRFLVYEVTAFSEEDTPVPYFELTSMAKEYSLQQMGRGELSAAYLIWRLEDLPAGSIALIEEPESHLATFSQDLLIDAIIAAVVERDLCIVVSSHSPGFFQKLPAKHISLVSSLPEPSVRGGLSISQLTSHLGIRPNIAALVLVEDKVASEFLYALLSEIDRYALSHIDIRTAANGESGVMRIISELDEGTLNQIAILGVLDGDQRPHTIDKPSGRIGYLIGDVPPEVLVRDVLTRWRSGEFSDWIPGLPGGADALKLSLERLDGLDLHDWIMELAKEFGGLRGVMRVGVDLLMRIDRFREDASGLLSWIREHGRLPG